MKTPQLKAMSVADVSMARTTRGARNPARTAGRAPATAQMPSRTTTPHTARWATISAGGTSASSFQNSGTTPHRP